MDLAAPLPVALPGTSGAFAGTGFPGNTVKPGTDSSASFAIPSGVFGNRPGFNRCAAPADQPRFAPTHSRYAADYCSNPGTVLYDTPAADFCANGNGYPIASRSDGYGNPDANTAAAGNAHRNAAAADAAAGHCHALAGSDRNPYPGCCANTNSRAYTYPYIAAYRRDCLAGGYGYCCRWAAVSIADSGTSRGN